MRQRMLLRLMLRSATVRRGRTLLTLLAIAVAAGVSTALLNLYVDMQAKLHREFRSYGANVIVTAREGASLPADTLSTIERELAGRGTAVSVAYAAVHTPGGSPVVVAGVDLERARKLDTWWSVSGWPSTPNSALIGVRALAALSPKAEPFDLVFDGRTLHLSVGGTLQTGGPEDSRVYLSQNDFAAWTGLQPSVIEIAVTGTPQAINEFTQRLGGLIPSAEVQPVRQIVEAEARVFDKTRSALAASVALIIVTAFLCVLATLISSVLDRRKDFAVMKALGASQRTANLLFAGESASLGAVGALVGYIAGVGAASLIGKINLHAGIEPRWSIFPIIVGGSIAMTLLTAAIPISILNRIHPAVILKGE
jgi:putative ABC transport system permease protein